MAGTKRCDGWRYCVQTDKTGKRPLAAMKVGGKMLCPYYPGFSYARTTLTVERVKQVTALLTALEKLIVENPAFKKKK